MEFENIFKKETAVLYLTFRYVSLFYLTFLYIKRSSYVIYCDFVHIRSLFEDILVLFHII